MKLTGMYALTGVLLLAFAGCGDNEKSGTYQKSGYPGPNGTVAGSDQIVGGQQQIGPNGEPLPYDPGNQNMIDGPVVGPNSEVLDPNALAIPSGQNGPYLQQPGIQNPIAQGLESPPLDQRPYPPQNGLQDLRRGDQRYGDQRYDGRGYENYYQRLTCPATGRQLYGSGSAAREAQWLMERRIEFQPFSSSMMYFRKMQVYSNGRAHWAFPGDRYVKFTRNLYSRYPDFRIDRFHRHYQDCHRRGIYGMRAVREALEHMRCHHNDVWIDIDIRID